MWLCIGIMGYGIFSIQYSYHNKCTPFMRSYHFSHERARDNWSIHKRRHSVIDHFYSHSTNYALVIIGNNCVYFCAIWHMINGTLSTVYSLHITWNMSNIKWSCCGQRGVKWSRMITYATATVFVYNVPNVKPIWLCHFWGSVHVLVKDNQVPEYLHLLFRTSYRALLIRRMCQMLRHWKIDCCMFSLPWNDK